MFRLGQLLYGWPFHHNHCKSIYFVWTAQIHHWTVQSPFVQKPLAFGDVLRKFRYIVPPFTWSFLKDTIETTIDPLHKEIHMHSLHLQLQHWPLVGSWEYSKLFIGSQWFSKLNVLILTDDSQMTCWEPDNKLIQIKCRQLISKQMMEYNFCGVIVTVWCIWEFAV